MAHLIFLTSTPSTVAQGSGTWVGISVLRDAIEALGHRVTLISPSPRGTGETTVSRILFNVRSCSHLRQLKADALIGFDLDGVFARGGGFLHVAAIKGVLADEANYERGTNRLALALQARLEARHVRRAHRVIATSVYSSERIAKFYGARPEKISIVPELIDLAAWQIALREAPVVEGPPRVLCVAHLYPRKGVDTLLRAVAGMRRNISVRIVGGGPERLRLEHLARDLTIADRVHFLGHVPFRALIAEYRNATVFALPTAQEGFGIVFLEAMASSVPIIAGRAGAVPEVVAEGETALLVPPEDDATLADALMTVLDHAQTRLAMGHAGYARVRRYDAPVVAQRFLDAIGITSG